MRASYRKGVEWIAINEEPGEMEADVVSENLTTALLAAIFGKMRIDVANDVVRYRQREASRQDRANRLSAAAEREYQEHMEESRVST